MGTFHIILSYLLDALFPKSAEILSLESLSPAELFQRLPAAREIDDPRLVVLFDYHDKWVRALIWEIKYQGNRRLARSVAPLLNDVLMLELSERQLSENFTNPLLIPMPISDKRRRERGYNQTEILAEALMHHFAVQHPGTNPAVQPLGTYAQHVLKKTLHTESQARTHATKRERIENLHNSMLVADDKKALLKGRCVILLDDVTTSGATFAEAKRALKAAGVKKVLCVALAH